MSPHAVPGAFLIVDDHDLARATLARFVSRHRPVRHASSYSMALPVMRARDRWCGFLFDRDLGDGDGLGLLAVALAEYPGTPSAIVTGYLDAESVNRAAELGALVIGKGFSTSELRPFLQVAIDRDIGVPERIARAVDARTRDLDLTPREHEIVVWTIVGRSRAAFLEFSGLSEGTWRFHVASVLRKTGAARLDEAASAIMATATRMRWPCV